MTNLPENHNDMSDHMRASPSDDHVHPINLRVHPATGKRSDWKAQGMKSRRG